MLFDSTMLARVAADIERTLIGGNVGRVLQSAYDEVCLESRARAEKPQIILSCNAEFGRVALTSGREPIPGSPDFAFCSALRKHLRGATLVAARQVNYDRILQLDFANCEGLGPQAKRTLIAEIMGRHGNLVLVDHDGEILACARQVTDRVNRYRQTLPGYEYVPPPGGEKLDPAVATGAELQRRLAAAVGDVRGKERRNLNLGAALRAQVSGCSDILLAEATARAGLSPETFVDELAPAEAELIAQALVNISAEACQPGSGFLYSDPEEPARGPVFAYPIALRSRLEWDAAETPDLSAAIEALHERLRSRQGTEQLRRHLQGIATTALQKAATREQERRRSLDAAQGADGFRIRGELLLAHLHAIPSGASVATVPDYYTEGTPEIEIPLDPKHTVQENAQAQFDRYRKLKRVLDRVPPLLNEAAQEREYLEGVVEQIELAESLTELGEIEVELTAEGYVVRKAGKAAKLRRPSGPPELPHFVTADGYTVIYGKTGLQNDEVVRQAGNNDIWLHVKDGPGGHVAIRTANKPDKVPESTLIAAAQRAALNSKWRRDSVVEVNYTLAKFVRKAPHGRPGFVYYTDHKTIAVKPG